ncbi:MAG: 7-cyano-7-deazaguanine synthase QueC [Parvibaculum sp.]|nr:7-cyano-7-deazaguanine synthase QueC [Parvibaculum sp.]
MTQSKALVLFSGGQDSTVCLASALSRFDEVETVGFDYGQTHSVELTCRFRVLDEIKAKFPQWGAKLGPDHMLNLRELAQISDTALTRDMAIEMDESGLPNTFVPGRNLLFFVYASALGYRRGATTLVGGMCETDYSGYPDCRNDTIQTLAQSVSLGMARDFTFETPLMYIDKAQTWALARELGGDALVDLIIEHTHTCYRGDRTQRHDWGYGCNTCPACELRANGFAKWQSASGA